MFGYVSPERFQAYEQRAYEAGFTWVKSGPFVRSSYHAFEGVASAAPQAAAKLSPHTIGSGPAPAFAV